MAAKEKIGGRYVESRRCWFPTWEGQGVGDSRGYNKVGAEAEARRLVKADPDDRELAL